MTRSADLATRAVVALELARDAEGWGDESTGVFVAVAAGGDFAFEQLLSIDGHPGAAMDDVVADGYGLGSEPLIAGVAFVSESWRHLDDDELREALSPTTVNRMLDLDDPQVWAGTADLFRARTRPRDLPGHLRREGRIATLLLRDGTLAQAYRDRGASDVTTSCVPLSDIPDDASMPWAMHRMLTAVGDVRVGRR